MASKITQDLFAKLPFEIIHMVASDLTLTDLLNLSHESWIANVQLRDDQRLWGKALETEILPFYHELGEFKEEEDSLLQRHHPKDLCVLIHSRTCPETGDVSPLPGIANRRRIWQTCLQFKNLHHRYVKSSPGQGTAITTTTTTTMSPLVEFQSESLRYGEAHRTAWPFAQADAIDTLEKYQPLLHSWENLAECIRHWVGVVWRSDGVLDTIRVTPCRGELDTDDDSEMTVGHDAESQAAEIPRGDWIRQLILHIPAFDAHRHRAEPYTILPRGLTVDLTSGKELSFGETDKGYNMRPLTASRDEAAIIGLSCEYGDDEGEGNADDGYQEEPQAHMPELAHEHLARYLWKSDYKDLLGGVRIWDVPGLHFAFPVRNVFTWSSEPDNPQPIALEALVWGTSPAHSGRVRRLSAWTPQNSPLIRTLKVDSAPADVETSRASSPVCQSRLVRAASGIRSTSIPLRASSLRKSLYARAHAIHAVQFG
ncbi:F-box domain-containing protein [Apiospora hydei]|uniref:F-box domain-containing protein n=1 Tax=Apiospora hydei TaxID=1337664 RepID=A0ABR1VL20_9PEZI